MSESPVTERSRITSTPGSLVGLWPRLVLILLAVGVLGLVWQAVRGSSAQAALSVQIALEGPTPTLAPNTGAVVGVVWEDLDADGLRETGEPPLSGAMLSLSQQGGAIVATAITGEDGAYRLADLQPGFHQLVAVPPQGYQLTTPAFMNLYVSVGSVLTIDFGARFVPTPTPTATPIPQLDIDDAVPIVCGGVIHGDTLGGANNIRTYACQPQWLENGPELAYRIALSASQLVTASFISTTTDLDLFLLRTAYPDTCLAAGDSFLTYEASPGLYYLAVDGYQENAGSFTLRLDCPREVQATETPRPTPSPTPTVTITPTPGPTATATATLTPNYRYLPLIMHRIYSGGTPTTLVLQQGFNGYAGVSDTTLNAWYPDIVMGGNTLLALRYNQQTVETTHMAPTLRFDLGLLPPNMQITQATLTLSVIRVDPARDIRGEVYGLLVPWRQETATWLLRDVGVSWNRPGAQGAGADHMTWYDDIQRILPSDQQVTLDVTDLVRLWSEQPASNYGMVLLAQAGESGSNLQVDFASSDYADVALRPKLTITYLAPLAAAGGR